MDQLRLEMLVYSYGIDRLLELSGIFPEKALEVLVNEGLIDLNDFFDEDGELNE